MIQACNIVDLIYTLYVVIALPITFKKKAVVSVSEETEEAEATEDSEAAEDFDFPEL